MAAYLARRLALMTALTLAVASPAFASTTITVTIGNTTLPAVTDGPVPIAGTYTHTATGGSISIANSGGTAQIEFPNFKSDGAEDSIKLVNARITATNGSVNNFPITLQGQEEPNPTTPSTIYYKMKAVGLFQQATGSSILVGMYLKNPMTDGFTFLNQQQYTPGSISFSISPPGTGWPPAGHSELSGTRILRVEIALKLALNKFLDFNTTNNSRFVEMYTSGTPDKGNPCSPSDDTDATCQEQNAPGLYLPSLLNLKDGQDGLRIPPWNCRVFKFLGSCKPIAPLSTTAP